MGTICASSAHAAWVKLLTQATWAEDERAYGSHQRISLKLGIFYLYGIRIIWCVRQGFLTKKIAFEMA